MVLGVLGLLCPTSLTECVTQAVPTRPPSLPTLTGVQGEQQLMAHGAREGLVCVARRTVHAVHSTDSPSLLHCATQCVIYNRPNRGMSCVDHKMMWH